MDKKTILIALDYLAGPIWDSDIQTGEPLTGIDVIDGDKELIQLNLKISDLYFSYYEFNSHDQPCWFNEKQEYKDRFIMLDLLEKLVSRLNEINDGSYVVEPIALEYYRRLCSN